MESEAPFVVEADEDARLQAATQGSSSVKGSAYLSEETPLLTDSTLTAGGADSADDGDESIDKPWLGTGGFEGKPRWRRPSVSTTICYCLWIHVSNLAIVLRYGG
jgi:hypothetical protein